MDLRQRPLEIFFPLALKLKLGRFEVRHALSYFFAFEEPVLGAGGFLRCAITAGRRGTAGRAGTAVSLQGFWCSRALQRVDLSSQSRYLIG
jgi:hypothetical protein